MKRITDWDILEEIAEKTPKSYSGIIRKRNKLLLNTLKTAWKNKQKIHSMSAIGCPHCGFCYNCIWSDVIGKLELACTYVKFGGITLQNATSYNNISVKYCPGIEYIVVKSICDTNSKKEYENCVAFLEAHIEWTNKFEWGSKYKPKRKKSCVIINE